MFSKKVCIYRDIFKKWTTKWGSWVGVEFMKLFLQGLKNRQLFETWFIQMKFRTFQILPPFRNAKILKKPLFCVNKVNEAFYFSSTSKSKWPKYWRSILFLLREVGVPDRYNLFVFNNLIVNGSGTTILA